MFRQTILSIAFLSVQVQSVEVKVKQGTILGTTEVSLFDKRFFYAFYGVPYAVKPIKSLRFKDPEAIKGWRKPLNAKKRFRGACAQPHIVHKHGTFGYEDCLYLNIYTPSLPKKENHVLKSVVVWIHGYAFASSFSHIHGPDFFIDQDVVFVSLTHRINVFGFLKVNDSDRHANMGMKDIAVGLKWINKNIGQFGGDKNQVTVMGSGSGATFLSLLLMTKYRKLFSKMILQSGGPFSPSIFQGEASFEKDQFNQNLAKLTPQPVMKSTSEDIIDASLNIYENKDFINLQKPLVPFSPIVETKSKTSIISSSPEIFFSNKNNFNLNIPIMIGFNSQESISEIIPFILNPIYLKMFSKLFKFMIPFRSDCNYNSSSEKYRVIGTQIQNKYFEEDITEKSLHRFMQYSSDLLTYPIYKFIKSYLKNDRNKMFVYKFNYVGKFNSVKATATAGTTTLVKGAASGDEICYLLACEPYVETYSNMSDYVHDQDYLFIKEISGLWANFVKFGDPTPKGQYRNYIWLPMTHKDDNVLLISKTRTRMINSNNEKKMWTFWNDIKKTYYKDCKLHDEL